MSYQKIGLICAMEEEIRLLERDMQAEQTSVIAGRTFYEGVLYGRPVTLVQSRIGKVAAASTATTLLDRFGVDCVIFCGTAGGIAPDLHTGDVVVADKLVQHDFFDGVGWFRIPLLDKSYFETEPVLTEGIRLAVIQYLRYRLKQETPQSHLDEFRISDPKVVTGTVVTGDQFICDPEKNRWIAEQVDNAKCVEMEGAAVAQICYEFGIPCAVVRVVSDGANDNSNLDFERFVSEAACHFTRGALKAFLENAE